MISGDMGGQMGLFCGASILTCGEILQVLIRAGFGAIFANIRRKKKCKSAVNKNTYSGNETTSNGQTDQENSEEL